METRDDGLATLDLQNPRKSVILRWKEGVVRIKFACERAGNVIIVGLASWPS